MSRFKLPAILFVILGGGLFFNLPFVWGDYGQEIRNQIQKLQNQYPGELDLDYFHDMGILARKADEAGLNDLTTEITGSLLLKRMDHYVRDRLDFIDRLFRTNAAEASRTLTDLNRMDRYYQPTAEYLSTTGGQALSSELAIDRQGAVEELKLGCSLGAIREGIQALRKTGLLLTNRREEIANTRTLINELECCLNWKSSIHYYYEAPFESEYEEGMMIEEGTLKIQSTPRDYKRARWVGEWVYRFEGREGQAQGVSRATLTYEKGEQPASLEITSSRISSSGRINFPISLAGDFRYLEVEGSLIFPKADMPGQKEIALAGCRNPEESAIL